MAAKRLPDHPNLEHYRRQAKDLRKALAAGDPAAFERLREFHPRADEVTAPKLSDAQLVLAREHGFASWPAFAAHVGSMQVFPGGIACESGRLALEIDGLEGAKGIVLFVLAGNVGREHLGIRQIGDHLLRAGYAAVLADLLTPQEAMQDAIEEELRFDVKLLSERAELALDFIKTRSSLPLALFCSGTGGAAGVSLAARRHDAVSVLVSAAGRPDLAGSALARVRAPTLFVVGGEDAVSHGFTRMMLEIFPRNIASKLEVVRGIGLRFEEGPGAARAAELAVDWLDTHLASGGHQEQAA